MAYNPRGGRAALGDTRSGYLSRFLGLSGEAAEVDSDEEARVSGFGVGVALGVGAGFGFGVGVGFAFSGGRLLSRLGFSTIGIFRKTSAFTGTTPALVMSIFFAASRLRSRMRPLTNGPRLLMRTITDFPFFKLVTRTIV